MTETWKDIIGYEGLYQVSDLGRIKVLPREFINISGRRSVVNEVIKVCPVNHRGYERAQLTSSDKTKKIFSVHRIVATHFIPNPNNLPEVNHKKGIKNDNRVSELEWCDKEYNEKHASDNGLKPRGNNSPKSILDEVQVMCIKKCLDDGARGIDLANYFKVSTATISSIKQGRNWHWLSYASNV